MMVEGVCTVCFDSFVIKLIISLFLMRLDFLNENRSYPSNSNKRLSKLENAKKDVRLSLICGHIQELLYAQKNRGEFGNNIQNLQEEKVKFTSLP